jgi:hypothetical protein
MYTIHEPAEDAERLPVRTPAVRPFPRAAFAALAQMLGWKPSLPSRDKPTDLVFSRRAAAFQPVEVPQ